MREYPTLGGKKPAYHEEPVDNTTQDGVGHLAKELTDGEDVRRVDPAGSLADEDTPAEDPHRLELTHDNSGEDGGPEANIYGSATVSEHTEEVT